MSSTSLKINTTISTLYLSGQHVYVKPLNAGIALFDLTGKSGSKSKQGIKYGKGEVQVVERAFKDKDDDEELGGELKRGTKLTIR